MQTRWSINSPGEKPAKFDGKEGSCVKQQEKTRRTYEKIMAAAVIEFGTKSYDKASLTTLCNENQISKGLIYHNFKNKDDLYLKCVEQCFREMTAYLKAMEYKAGSVQESMKNLFRIRQQFFEEHPYFCNLFFYTVLQPPKHLRKEIQEIRKSYEEFYLQCFREVLQQVRLRDGITLDAAMEYFMAFLEMFNGYFQNKSGDQEDIHALIEDHEVNLSKIMNLMLYGVAKEEQEGR